MTEANFPKKADIINEDPNLGEKKEKDLESKAVRSEVELQGAFTDEILSGVKIVPDNEIETRELFENAISDDSETRYQENFEINRNGETGSVINSNAETILRDIEKGVITVKEGNDQEALDLELVRLEKIPKFEPLMKTHSETSFTFGGLWGFSLTSQESDKEPSFGYESFHKFSSIYQSHIRRCADEICEDQRIIMETVKSVDEYCAGIGQTMITTQLQAKNNQDQIGIVTSLTKQAEKTRKLTYEIFQTLNNIDTMLPEEERLMNRLASNKWPALHKLRSNMKQNQYHHGLLTKKISRINPSHSKVSLDTVLSEKHQFSDATRTSNMSPDRATLSSVQSLDKNVSNRLKEIYSNTSQNAEEIFSIQWLPLPLGLNPSFKRTTNNANVESIVSSPEVATPMNSSGLSLSTSDTLTSINNKSQSSVSLLTAMLKKSSTQRESGPRHKNPKKVVKKKSAKSESESEYSQDELLNSNDRVRPVEKKKDKGVKKTKEGTSDSDEEYHSADDDHSSNIVRPILY